MLSRIKYIGLNPARLFVLSFLGLILIGTILLLLPVSTTGSISLIDALFTTTSAVCVTGLVALDTSKDFTLFGQTVIMVMIQAGGLGILTFASYFSYFFKGGSSYEDQLTMGNISNIEKIDEIFKTLKRILIITVGIEAVGAFFIFTSLSSALMPGLSDRIYFSVFHSISAFCNAGFSTLPHGIMENGYVDNYRFQLSLIFLFVLGGLGFPIVINLLKYLKHLIRRTFLQIFNHKKDVYKPWVMKLGSKINLITTFSLIVIGTILIFINEYNNILVSHQGIGKFVTALFTATTPRTAGFNSIDFNQLHLSSLIIIIILMWIGASPASTGGGIKTSTFAIAVLNFISLAKGRKNIEVYSREVSETSIRRAFAVMTLSVVVLGIGSLLISYFDEGLRLLDIIFESVSAYSTVGLSLGITSGLSSASKLVLIILMFIGRVTTLTLLIAFFKQVRMSNYTYPSEEILIN
ncbi:TrkH family potassium uptake protein [Parabacteroides sp. Marseille-P3160]|uniref:TrkH family potassium uptake protein n=1 Tax=Parabacteroides sp. Marseille-P3160 TaxID=1917887 RepID=UPI0009BBA1C1|nr:potassium transporter TrkG [Parabacteroides sp. Marseille-P3160]